MMTLTGNQQCATLSFLSKWAREGKALKIEKVYFEKVTKDFSPEALDAAYSLYPWFMPKGYVLKWFQEGVYDRKGRLRKHRRVT